MVEIQYLGAIIITKWWVVGDFGTGYGAGGRIWLRITAGNNEATPLK